MSIRSAALRSTVTCLAAAAAAPLAAQTSTSQPEIQACYDSRTSSTGTPLGSGLVYRIKVPGVVGQQGCVDPKHTPFSWTIQHGALTGMALTLDALVRDQAGRRRGSHQRQHQQAGARRREGEVPLPEDKGGVLE